MPRPRSHPSSTCLPRWILLVILFGPLIVWYFHASLHYLRGSRTIFIVAQSGPGRLGNQLFEYASVLGIYEDRQRHNPFQDEILFCIDRNHPFTLLEQIFQGPFPPCPETMPVPRHLGERGYGIYTKFDETQYCSSSSQGLCAFTFGPYLQSYKYLQLSGKSIRSALTFASHHNVIETARSFVHRVRTNPTTAIVRIHVRRGDVLQVDYLRVASVEYLRKAMRHYETEFGSNVRFILTSDDWTWCQTQTELFAGHEFDVVKVTRDEADPVLDLAILSHCDHMILTVGTFGWWGAWLGMAENVVYNQDAIVLDHATNRGQIRLEDYYPPMWTGISSA
jgi:galactoside 2-L-fucosyltransferase 1/2